MATQNIAVSTTSERSNTQGKVCTVGRFITAIEAQKIVDEAATWEGTPYAAVGALSQKGPNSKADCSGSTNKIYVNAGFSYPYIRSINMVGYIAQTSRFRKIDPSQTALQAGDIIVWPAGHIAIYMPFAPDHPKYKTRHVNRSGNAYQTENNMWTAFTAGGEAYGAYNYAKFRSSAESVFFYRYYLLPGEAGC